MLEMMSLNREISIYFAHYTYIRSTYKRIEQNGKIHVRKTWEKSWKPPESGRRGEKKKIKNKKSFVTYTQRDRSPFVDEAWKWVSFVFHDRECCIKEISWVNKWSKCVCDIQRSFLFLVVFTKRRTRAMSVRDVWLWMCRIKILFVRIHFKRLATQR